MIWGHSYPGWVCVGILNPRVLHARVTVGSVGSLDLVRCVRIIQAIGTSSQTPAPVTKHDRSREVPRGGCRGCVCVARHIKVLAGYFRFFFVLFFKAEGFSGCGCACFWA